VQHSCKLCKSNILLSSSLGCRFPNTKTHRKSTHRNSFSSPYLQLNNMAIPPGQAPWPVDLPPWMSSNNANEYTIDSFPDHKANQRNESKSALERAAMVPLLTNNRMKSTPVYRFIILSPQAPSRIDLLESYSEASIDRDFKAGLLGKGSTEICSGEYPRFLSGQSYPCSQNFPIISW